MSGIKTFVELLTETPRKTDTRDEVIAESARYNASSASSYSAEEALRAHGLKIKLVTPTAFGVQFDMARKYDANDISDALSKFKYEVKGNMIFVKF